MRPRRPSATAVLAWIALFVALGGSAAGAHHFLITSTRQIKPSVLRSLHGARGPAGVPGTAGAPGTTGPAGPAGPVNLSALAVVRAPLIKVPNKEVGTSVATCPAGERVVSGGQYTGFAAHNGSEMSEDHQSWIVLVANNTGIETNLEAIAYCAAAGRAIAAGPPLAAHARALRQAAALASRLRREMRS